MDLESRIAARRGCGASEVETRRLQGEHTVFWACSNHPFCESVFRDCPKCNQMPLQRQENLLICVDNACGHGMLVTRQGPSGEFVGCTEYRKEGASCTYTENPASSSDFLNHMAYADRGTGSP